MFTVEVRTVERVACKHYDRASEACAAMDRMERHFMELNQPAVIRMLDGRNYLIVEVVVEVKTEV